MAPSLRREVKFLRQAATKHGSSKTRKSILKAKSSLRHAVQTRTMTVSERRSAAHLAISQQRASRKESRTASEAGPSASSSAASVSSSKPNRVDKAASSNKGEAQSRPSKRDQGCATSTRQAGVMSRSVRKPPHLSPEQAPRLRTSVPPRFKGPLFESDYSDESDDVDDPDCMRTGNSTESEPLQRVTAADSAAFGKTVPRQRERNGRSKKVAPQHSGKTGIKRHVSIATELDKDSKKPKLQDAREGHQKKVAAGKGQQKVAPTSGLVTAKAEQSGRQIAAPSGISHIIADPLRSFREPVARQKESSYKCCVKGCPLANGEDEVGIWLFALPCEEEESSLRSAWLEGVAIDVEANRPLSPRVCFRHFDTAKDFVTLRHRVRGLEVNAVPSIQIPVRKVKPYPFGHRSLQMQNRTGTPNAGAGLAANSAVGSNTPTQEAREAMAASSRPGSASRRYLQSVAKSTKVMERTATETSGKNLHVTLQPINAVGPSSSSMTETRSRVTANHTEVVAHTVSGKTGETLHAAPGPQGAISPSGSLAGTPSKVTAHHTEVGAHTVSGTTGGTLHAEPGSQGAVSPRGSLQTETSTKVTADHTEVSAHTVSGTEALHTAPGPQGAISPTGSLRAETPSKVTADHTEVSAHTVSGTEALHAAPGLQGAISPTGSLRAETPSNVTADHTEVSAHTVSGTEALHAAPGLQGAISPTGSLRAETPSKVTADHTEGGACTVPGTTGETLHMAPGPHDTVSPSGNLKTAVEQQGAAVESSVVSAEIVVETTWGNEHAASETKDATDTSAISMTETRKQATLESVEVSVQATVETTEKNSHATPQAVGVTSPSTNLAMETPKEAADESVDGACTLKGRIKQGLSGTPQLNEALSTGSSSTAEALREPKKEPAGTLNSAREPEDATNVSDASNPVCGAHTEVQPTEEDSDVVPQTQDTTGNGDTGSELETAHSPSPPIECTFSASCESISVESKILQQSTSGAKEPSTDSNSDTLDCFIVHQSPASIITVSSDEDDSRPGGEANLVDGAVETRVPNTALAHDSNPSAVPGHSYVCKRKRASSDICDGAQAAVLSQNSASASVPCIGHDARASAVRSDTSMPVTISLNSCDEKSSPLPILDVVEKATRNSEAGDHELPPPKRDTEHSALVRAAEPPPVSPLSRARDGKQKTSVTLGLQNHGSGTSSGTSGRSASVREGCDSAATVVVMEKMRCPPCDGRDALSCAVTQETGAAPSGPTSFDRQRLQMAGKAAATHCASVQKHSSDASVGADVNGTDSGGQEEGGGVILFDPSQGSYIIEREVLGDEDEFGMHAVSYRVDWVFTGVRPNMSRGPICLQ